jgi:hypothetical protein
MAVAIGASVLGCSSAATGPRPERVTPAPTATPTATVAPSPGPSPTAAPTASPKAAVVVSPSPSPSASPTPAPNDPSLGLDGFTRQPYTFTISKGQTFSIVLPGHSTEGLKWALATGFDIKVVSGTGQSRPGTKPANAGNGVSPPQVFDFTAVGSGPTTLVFDLLTPYDPKKAAAETRKFAVNVL